ncbi:MAG: protein kinase, partial [Candidatus Rokubacteria bacterium]|nr:protein kinase [Candidatus Rokubacteria bacterium]
MIEKIGKYRILERIGRGGMGTVFKAHDPILDRLVALKVISSEGEVTDELKTRFYREAQACARLNHPNIVVVHDLGEDAGRLFIVMEFLDGEELKLLISQRRTLPLEDKLALMVQVCDGLNYAHQNGVIHRDVKPGNIFVLRNGQVKILDFGIARIAAADTGLTRTGFIMGTLRYMSPEQARGRVDQRSDQFSAGAVFYELLTYRPAFDAEDPMETLEKLRSENPPPLAQVDPSIPPDVASAIEKALRKDPAQRFPDLGQMRVKLEQARRRLTDEAERLQAHVRAQLEELAGLRRRLATCACESTEDETVPVVDERMRLGDLRALERQLAEQLEGLRANVAQAESVQPALTRGLELLEQGDFPAASAQLESILREMPEHGQAQDGLRRARAAQEEIARLLGEARAAHEQHADARCLELLSQLASVSAAAAAAPATAQLRGAAEEAQRARATAEAARERMRQVRGAAEQAEAARHAAAAWSDAEAKAIEGDLALDQHTYPRAEARFQEAGQAYEGALRTARQAGEALRAAREQAETASQQAAEARQAAAQLSAASYAAPKWTTAQAREASGQSALGRQDFPAARTLLTEAWRLYQEAAQDARVAAEAEAKQKASQAEVERVRQAVAAARRTAEEAAAPQLAAATFAKAAAAEQGGTEALARQAFADALGRFHAAEQGYQEAARQAGEARLAARARAEAAVRAVGQAREAAAGLDPATYAAAAWAAAQAKESAGQSALGREDYVTAPPLLAEAQRLYEEAARGARAAAEAEAKRKTEHAEATRLRQAVATARRAAEEARAPELAAGAFAEGQAAEQAGEAAFGREASADAQARFRAAEQAYQQAARQAAEQQAVRAALADAQRLIAEGRPDRALEALARVRASAPTHPELAKLEGQARRAAEARKVRDQVRGLTDNARRLTAQGDLAGALGLAEEAVRLVPDDAAALRLRDDLQERLQQASQAPAPASPDAGVAEAEARRKAEAEAGRKGETEAQARRKAEAGAEARRRAEAEAEARRRAEQAEQAVRAALTDAPRLIGEGRPDRALEAIARARAVDPDHPELAKLDAQAQHLLEARKVRERVRGLLDNARKLQARGELAKAFELAEQAAGLVPDDASALRLRDDLQERLRQAGETPRAAAAPAGAAEAEVAAAGRPAPARGFPRAKVGIAAGVVLVIAIVGAYAMRQPRVEPPKPPELEKPVLPAPPQPPAPPPVSPERAKAEELRKSMLAARDEARNLQAERLAPESWRAAGEKEREAEAALGKQDFARARVDYGEAQQRYAAATAETKKRLLVLTETAKVLPLQEQAAQARRRAEVTDAPKLSAPLWAKATDAEKTAEDALKRQEFEKAQTLFREAEQAYKAAEGDASQKKAAISKEEQERLEARRRDLQATEKLAGSATDARRKAEQAAATRYAPKAFALAVDKEKEAQAALGKQDYSGAQRRFREAEQEYERARQEAAKAAETEKKDAELQAQRQRETEQARGQMAQARSQAEQVDAKRLAAKLWQDALAKESDGQAALGRGQYAAAQQRFKDAQQEYDRARQEALKAAETERQRAAEAERQRQEAERQR